MANTIRNIFKEEVEELLPSLHETYRLVGIYQSNRNKQHEALLLTQLDEIGQKLAFFRGYIQPTKRGYFDAILTQDLPVSDRIIALDVAVGSMHIEFSIPRAYMHQESKRLREVLELSRQSESEVTHQVVEAPDGTLLQGIPASPGVVTGKAAIIRRKSDYRRLPQGCIAVATMTRPEFILGADRISGIVTDLGGSLCHAAIIARELGIPCVVGTTRATKVIQNRWLVLVDGSIGIVKRVP